MTKATKAKKKAKKKISSIELLELYKQVRKPSGGELVFKNIARLKPSPFYIPRHDHDYKLMLQASMEKYGFWGAIYIDENNVIINGHLRVEIARELGLDYIPVIVLRNLTETQREFMMPPQNK